MFITERKENDVFKIDGNIEIKILNIKENTVKIGIKAPKNIYIAVSELNNQDGYQKTVHEH